MLFLLHFSPKDQFIFAKCFSYLSSYFLFVLNCPMNLSLIAVFLYIAALTIPYVQHKKVSDHYKKLFDPQECYSEEPGKERAAYITDNTEALEYRLKMIREAKEEVIVSTFDFNADTGGKDVMSALIEAADNDRKILVEETIIGREVECAVLGNLDVKASGVGEILSADEFYDFDAKYYNSESKTLVDPPMPENMREQIREDAVKIFMALDGRGLSRVDFFLTESGVVFNEINTLPGFTAISMYPMLWEAQGIPKKELVQKLIDLAFER